MRSIQIIFCLAIIVAAFPLASASSTATIQGVVYEWDTFEPADNAYIEINTTPTQYYVPQYGVYSFELPPGEYVITATSYNNNSQDYRTELPVTITDNGTYVIDILLTPVYSTLVESENTEEDPEIQPRNRVIGMYILLAIILLIAVMRPTSKERYQRKPKDSRKTLPKASLSETSDELKDIDNKISEEKEDETAPQTDEVIPEDHILEEEVEVTSDNAEYLDGMESLPDDLQEVVQILISNDGRMTQKYLRSKMRYSEGKVSMMVNDLERRGWIDKVKKGRGNIIFLRDERS